MKGIFLYHKTAWWHTG